MYEFLTTDSRLSSYMAFPRFLLDLNLSETAGLLYMVLLDRARLSMQNDGWTDGRGRIFIYFTIEDLADTLHKSAMTIKNGLRALEQEGLIWRKRRGIGMPNRIYVKTPAGYTGTDRKLSTGQTENRQEKF